jgi:hypothetical protein
MAALSTAFIRLLPVRLNQVPRPDHICAKFSKKCRAGSSFSIDDVRVFLLTTTDEVRSAIIQYETICRPGGDEPDESPRCFIRNRPLHGCE